MLKKNLFWIFSANIFVILTQIGTLCLLVRLVQPEEFGLIGVFSTFLAVGLLLDLGISPTFTRELARLSIDSANAGQSLQALRSYEWILVIITAISTLLIILLSTYLSTRWLKIVHLSSHTVTVCLIVMAIQSAFQMLINFYTAGMQGLQLIPSCNKLLLVVQTFKVLCGLFSILILKQGILTYLLSQALVTAIGAFFYRSQLYEYFKKISSRESLETSIAIDFNRLIQNKEYTLNLAIVGICSFLITQSDKIILTNIISLADYGIYAAIVTIGVMLAGGAGLASRVVLPRMIQLIESGNIQSLATLYLNTIKFLGWLILTAASILIFFRHALLNFYLGTANSTTIETIFALLIMGYALHSLVYIPYTLSLAFGWSNFGMVTSLISLLFMVPLTVGMTLKLGTLGTATAWLITAICYALVCFTYVHNRFLRELRVHLLKIIAIPLLLTTLTFISGLR